MLFRSRQLTKAIGARDAVAMARSAESILAAPASSSDTAFWLAAGAGIVGYLAQNRADRAHGLMQRHQARLANLARRDLAIGIALAHVSSRSGK